MNPTPLACAVSHWLVEGRSDLRPAGREPGDEGPEGGVLRGRFEQRAGDARPYVTYRDAHRWSQGVLCGCLRGGGKKGLKKKTL